MALAPLETLLEGEPGGIWFLPHHVEVKELKALAKRKGFAFFHIEGRNISRKEQLLNQTAMALQFPKDFGHNWDALEECLTDMEWVDADGYVIYYDHIDPLLTAHPDQFETLIEILRDAVTSWKEDGTAMVVLLSGSKAPKGVSRMKPGGDDGDAA